jgi:hypothetical protein
VVNLGKEIEFKKSKKERQQPLNDEKQKFSFFFPSLKKCLQKMSKFEGKKFAILTAVYGGIIAN